MTLDELEAAYNRIVGAGWPGNGTGPWVDAMDQELRTKFPTDHQLLIVGFGLGRTNNPLPSDPGEVAAHVVWQALLVAVTKRSRSDAARIDLGYGRTIRPPSVLPSGVVGQARRRRYDRTR